MPLTNVLLISTFPFLTQKPTGAAAYNLRHMAYLAEQGHRCLMVCPLTDGSRAEALATLRDQHVQVTSQEQRGFVIDHFTHGHLQVQAITDCTRWWIRIAMLPWIWVRGHLGVQSSIPRNLKSFREIVQAIVRHGGTAQQRFSIMVMWLGWHLAEHVILRLIPELQRTIQAFSPAYVFVDAHTHLLDMVMSCMSDVQKRGGGKIIPVVNFSNLLPFGPMALFSAEQSYFKTACVQQLYARVDGYLVVSNYLKTYLDTWGGMQLDARVVYPRVETPKQHDVDHQRSPHRGFITLINACNEKGLPIFLALAQRLPHVPFAAVMTWGSLRGQQRKLLQQLPNVQILKAMSPVDPIYDLTRILLVPSLWDEAFGMVVIEAMLRGIPVLASQVGGLPEAKLGLDYVLPVQPFSSAHDYAKTLPHDIDPWLNALEALLASPAHYQALSRASQEAALAFIAQVNTISWVDAFEPRADRVPPG